MGQQQLRLSMMIIRGILIFRESKMVKVVGNFEVKDWTHWKKMFDEHSGPREAAGIKTIYAVSYTHLTLPPKRIV